MATAEVEVVPTLAENEAVIERGERTFIEVGQALLTIRDKGQFVDAGYETFEDYVKQRWAMSGAYAYVHIGAARISTMVEKHGLPTPPTERAARPLVRRMNDAGAVNTKTGELRDPAAGERAVIDAWQQVLERHDGIRPITGRDVLRVVNPSGASGTPGWHELLGRVGDDITHAGKHMNKLEQALSGKRPTKEIKTKAGRYAAWAEDLAARLRGVER